MLKVGKLIAVWQTDKEKDSHLIEQLFLILLLSFQPSHPPSVSFTLLIFRASGQACL